MLDTSARHAGMQYAHYTYKVYTSVMHKNEKSTTPAVPRRSPIQVLGRPYVA